MPITTEPGSTGWHNVRVGETKRLSLEAAWELSANAGLDGVRISSAEARALLHESGIRADVVPSKIASFALPIMLRRVNHGETLWRYCNSPENTAQCGRFLTPHEYSYREDADLGLALLPQFTNNDAKVKHQVRCIAPEGALVLQGRIRHADAGVHSLLRVKVESQVIKVPTTAVALQVVWLGGHEDFHRHWSLGPGQTLPSRIPTAKRTQRWISQARQEAEGTSGNHVT